MTITVICQDCGGLVADRLPDDITIIAKSITQHRNESHNGARTDYDLLENDE